MYVESLELKNLGYTICPLELYLCGLWQVSGFRANEVSETQVRFSWAPFTELLGMHNQSPTAVCSGFTDPLFEDQTIFFKAFSLLCTNENHRYLKYDILSLLQPSRQQMAE